MYTVGRKLAYGQSDAAVEIVKGRPNITLAPQKGDRAIHLQGILLPFLNLIFAIYQDPWYFVTKIVLTYCEKKLFQ